MMKYDEEADNNASATAYGIVTHMFYHRLFHDQAPRVVIFADWFVPIGFDSCGLMQVKYHPNFESEKAAFLDMCEPVNLMLWPAQPFEYDWKKRDSHKDPNNLFVVIHR